MRSRTIREGSVGLFILLGVGLFGAILLWLRGLQPGSRSYKVTIEFANAVGLQVGSPVRFRGVNIGKVVAVEPGSNGVSVTTEIEPASLLIPRGVLVEVSQSGFVGEVSVDFVPRKPLPTAAIASNTQPFQPDCDPALIVCDGDILRGQVGVSYDELVRATVKLAEVLGDPELIANVKQATRNVGVAAVGVDRLSTQARQELAGFSRTANSVTGAANQVNRLASSSGRTINSVTRAADQVSLLASGSGRSINRLENRLGQTANRVGNAADQVTSLVQTNRGTLVTTLNDLSQTSRELRLAVSSLSPAIKQIGQGELVQNLEVLTANAAQASANLRDVSAAINSPTNLLVLQQTLDSARITFQNTQKITSELDELTGDPALRNNLRNLINGLSKLVSSTQDLEEQMQTADNLTPLPGQVAQKKRSR